MTKIRLLTAIMFLNPIIQAMMLVPETPLLGCLKTAATTLIRNDIPSILIAPTDSEISRNFDGLVLYRTTFLGLETFLGKVEFKPSTYIILIDDINVLNGTLASIKLSSVYSTYSNLLLVITDDDESFIHTIAQYLWNLKLLRSQIVVSNRHRLEVSTVELIQCGAKINTKRVISLESGQNCTNYTKVQNDLKSILKGCPLNIITGVMPPFVNSENDTLKGVFMEMIEVFGYISQMRLVIRPYDPIYLEEITNSYSFEAILEDFDSGYAEVFVGPIHPVTASIMDVGPWLWSNNLVLSAPRAFISGPVHLLMTPSNVLNIAFVSSAIGSIVTVFYLLARNTVDGNYLFNSLIKTHLIFFGLVLNVPTLVRVPRNVYVRLFLVCMLSLSMLITSYMQGIWISILNGPFYEPPVKTVTELLHGDYPIKFHSSMAMLFMNSDCQHCKDMAKKYTPLNTLDLFSAGNQLLEDRNFATIIYEGFLIMNPNIHNSFSVIDLLFNIHTVAMPKNYYMHKEFCDWLTRIVEHGILVKFWKLYEFAYSLEYSVESESRVYKVTMRQFEPALCILVFGYAFASLAFILEHVVFRCRKYYLQRK